jgi:hypothetical protein
MKRVGRITGVLLMLLIAGSAALNAQMGMKGSMDTTMMKKRMEMRMARGMGHGPDSMMMRGMRHGSDSMMMRGMRPGMGMGNRHMGYMDHMRPGMGHFPMYGMRGMRPGMGYGMRPGMGYGMRPGMGRMPMDRMAMGPAAPGRLLDNIPNLTDKQKKEIADLRSKQMEEMKKFREETAAKMKGMREADKTKIMNLLTDEQKKFIDGGLGTTTPPAKKK